jgi:hypothetical protein
VKPHGQSRRLLLNLYRVASIAHLGEGQASEVAPLEAVSVTIANTMSQGKWAASIATASTSKGENTLERQVPNTGHSCSTLVVFTCINAKHQSSEIEP